MAPRAPRHAARTAFSWALGLLVAGYVALLSATTYIPLRHADILISEARARGLDPAWVAAVIRCESRFRDTVISSAGAVGLMQIMPQTGEWIAHQIDPEPMPAPDLFDPLTNIRLGTWYLAQLVSRFESLDAALWAYNAGPANAEAWRAGSGTPFPETQAYVARVHRFLPIYRLVLSIPWGYEIAPPLPL